MPGSAATILWQEVSSMKMGAGIQLVAQMEERICLWYCCWAFEPALELLYSVLFVNKTNKAFVSFAVKNIPSL